MDSLDRDNIAPEGPGDNEAAIEALRLLRKLIDRVVCHPHVDLDRFDLTVQGRLDSPLRISAAGRQAKENPRALRLGGVDGCGSRI